jgi:hypothetical protein
MAGFDFERIYSDSDLALLRSLLAKLQRVARTRQLEVHYRSNPATNNVRVVVDGPLPAMQSLLPVLAKVLPAFAEGASVPPTRSRRRLLAENLTKNYWKGVLQATDTVSDLVRYLGGGSFRGAAPNSFFFDSVPHDDALTERLWSLSKALLAYDNGEIDAVQMVEEIHTSLEWVMQVAIGKSVAKDLSFAGMAEFLRDERGLSPQLCTEVVAMKNLRVGAKHKLRGIDNDNLNERLFPCIEAIHLIVRDITDQQKK